jgi:predicted Zn-dependent peptidase
MATTTTRHPSSWWPVAGTSQRMRTAGPPSPLDRPAKQRRPTAPPLSATRRDALLLLPSSALLPPALNAAAPPPALSSSSSSSSSSLATTLAASLEARVREYTLSTGLRLLVVHRPEGGPVLSVTAHHDVGAWDERQGQTGYAHLLEHMMFKGTPRTGTLAADGGGNGNSARDRDRLWREEREALERVDDAFEAVREARRAAGLTVEGYSIAPDGNGTSSSSSSVVPADVSRLEADLGRLVADAARFARQEDGYGALLQSAGAVGLNATTSHDETRYFCSLPANKLELWMALEAERLAAPVFRQLHEEKLVVAEERRARVEASPRGAFFASLAERAYSSGGGGGGVGNITTNNNTNPYGRPVLGYAEDLAATGRRELAAFFRERYQPRHAVVAVVGDVATATGMMAAASSSPSAQRACDKVAAMAERYFGLWEQQQQQSITTPAALPLAAEPLPRFAGAANSTTSPLQTTPDYTISSPAGPSVYLAYPRPSLAAGGPDAVALEAACDALASGRASRLYTRLVQPGGVALGATLLPGWPGDKHAGLALAAAVPIEAERADEQACLRLARRVQDEAERLADQGVTAAELARVKKGAAVGLLSATQSNASLAGALAAYEASSPGGWRGLLAELGELEALTGEQVRNAAARTFVGDGGRFLAVMLPAGAGKAGGAGGGR